MSSEGLQIFNKNQTYKNVIKEISKIGPDEDFVFDLSNKEHYEYWMLLLDHHDITSERYPQLHEHFNRSRSEHRENGIKKLPPTFKDSNDDGFVNNNAIAGLSSYENKCSALGYSTIIDGTTSTLQVLQVLDSDTLEPLSSNSQNEVGNGRYVQVASVGDSKVRTIKAVLNYAMIIDDVPYYGAVHSDNQAGAMTVPVVEQPASKPEHKDLKNIMIALSRGYEPEDVDYWFHKGEVDNNIIVVPFVGNVKFQSEIQELVPDESLFANMTVVRAEGGEKKVKPHNMDEVYKWFSRAGDPDDPDRGNCLLKWNLPCDGDGETVGKPISFEKSPWVADTVTLYQCTIGVKTKNSPEDLVWAFVISKQEEEGGDNLMDAPGLKYIKPLVFYWHCLAKGTQILLADGSTRPIELLDCDESVQINNSGATLPIRATTLAHFTGEVLRVTTDAGDQITLSKCHVLMTPNGPKSADEIKNGDTVITIRGNAKIKSIETIGFDADLINLLLGEYDQLETVGEYGTTMFANNILVGDHQIQTKYLEYKRSHPDVVLSRLDPEWHRDFHSSLEDYKRGVAIPKIVM